MHILRDKTILLQGVSLFSFRVLCEHIAHMRAVHGFLFLLSCAIVRSALVEDALGDVLKRCFRKGVKGIQPTLVPDSTGSSSSEELLGTVGRASALASLGMICRDESCVHGDARNQFSDLRSPLVLLRFVVRSTEKNGEHGRLFYVG